MRLTGSEEEEEEERKKKGDWVPGLYWGQGYWD